MSERVDPRAFGLSKDIVFLNHGSFGACPLVMMEEYRRWQDRLEEQPVLFHRELPGLMRTAREALAEFVQCEAQDIVYVQNATWGVNVVAHALDLQPGDEILTNDHEYGACDRAWQVHQVRRGVNLVRVALEMPVPANTEIVERYRQGITARTRVLYVSHVTSPTAVRMPVEELCALAAEHGLISVVDGAHAPGHLPLDLSTLGADVYTANLHKWMCTPKGSAFLYVRRDLQPAMLPLVVSWGWESEQPGDSPFIDQHEYVGTRDPAAYLTVPFALRWMQELGWADVQRTARELRRYGLDLLCSIPGVREMRSGAEDADLMMGAVLLPPDTDVDRLKTWLYDEHRIEVVVHRWLNTPILRFSAHIHTKKGHLDVLGETLRGYLATYSS
jgi:isopenicillin-N epimerase